MASTEGARRSFSVTALLASFFGAAMIAAAFAYFNYKFSEYKFINFKEWILYEKRDLFVPKEPYYTLLIYNSKTQDPQKLLSNKQQYPVLALDFSQERFANQKGFIYVTAPTNTLLSIIQRFNIYKTPSVLIIKQFKESLYKQDSMIQVLN